MGKKILIGCGIVSLALVLIVVGGIVWLVLLPEGGVKYKNEMQKYALSYLDEHKILEPGEDVVAYYDTTIKMKGTEAAILTSRRVIYHKDGKNDVMELTNIKDVRHHKETLTGDVIEIEDKKGNFMSIEIAPLNNGEKFLNALNSTRERAQSGETGAGKAVPGKKK